MSRPQAAVHAAAGFGVHDAEEAPAALAAVDVGVRRQCGRRCSRIRCGVKGDGRGEARGLRLASGGRRRRDWRRSCPAGGWRGGVACGEGGQQKPGAEAPASLHP
jgi:hypothetical protein